MLKKCTKNEQIISVEMIQDEVIRFLFENGFHQYSDYRKRDAVKRALWELYRVTKRNGKKVSFKPEKITLAIAKAFKAENGGELSEAHLETVNRVAANVIQQIQQQCQKGKPFISKKFRILWRRP